MDKEEFNNLKAEVIDMLEGIRDWAEDNSMSVDGYCEEFVPTSEILSHIKYLIKDVEKWEEE